MLRPAAILRFAPVLLALAAVSLKGQSQAPPVFRATVDRIAVDVEVVDRTGQPVAGLGPDKFTVAIDGRKRRVVTADMIRYGSLASALTADSPTGSSDERGAARPSGRVIMIAVDCLSFSLAESRAIVSAAREFVRR